MAARKPSRAPATRLVVDVGNTHTVLGVFHHRRLAGKWRLPTRKDATADEIRLSLAALFPPGGGPRPAVAAYASVVPPVDRHWMEALESHLGASARVLDASTCSGFRIALDEPGRVGADRLANVYACIARGWPEAIVVDLGTATTFDVWSQGTYWGGLICPGVQTSLAELARRASKLSEVDLHWDGGVIGRNTGDALRRGVLLGAVGQIEHIVHSILAERPLRQPRVIATGGLAPLVGGHCPSVNQIIEDFTLTGLDYFLAPQEYRK